MSDLEAVGVSVERLDPYVDVRGTTFEPIDAAALPEQRNVHVVTTAPGHVRGNHRHRRSTEVLVVVGPALARFERDGRVVDHAVEEGAVVRFRIPAGVAHALKNTGGGTMWIVSFGSAPYDEAAPDRERVELL